MAYALAFVNVHSSEPNIPIYLHITVTKICTADVILKKLEYFCNKAIANTFFSCSINGLSFGRLKLGRHVYFKTKFPLFLNQPYKNILVTRKII